MKNYNIFKENLTDSACDLLIEKFGYKGIGYYHKIITLLLNTDGYSFKYKDLCNLAKEMKVSKKQIETFIGLCTNCFNGKGMALLSTNEICFWNDTIFLHKQKEEKVIKNLIKKGRKKLTTIDNYKIENYELVNLTKSQFDKLVNKYGRIFTLKAINILNDWFKSNTSKTKKYLNKNNYGHFRKDSWVINETKKLLNY